jgi:quercetin dioxygenase-like cupin family protein
MKLAHLSAIAIVALSLNAAADEPKANQVARKVLERHDQSGVPGKEIVIGIVTFPAGSSIGFHTHPGDETGYVLTGSIILKTRGQPDRIVKAGESFFNQRGAIHSVVALPTGEGGMVLSNWIVDKEQALATPVP